MTIAETKNWSFFITAITWHEIDAKIQTLPIEKLLNPSIEPKEYGQEVEKILCTMIATRGSINQPFLEYDSSKKTIAIGLKLPYKTIETASEAENNTLMKHAFLKGILTMSTLKALEHYNFNQLHQAVKTVFFPKEKA